LLVGAAAGLSHAQIIGDPDRPLTEIASSRLADFVARRLAREPISRIINHREFWSLPFAVDGVLDPRADTEILVSAVLDALGERRRDDLLILDLGTGSGAILAALLHECPRARGLGVDRSDVACRTARHNLDAAGCGSRALVLQGDWAQAIGGAFDLVVANPPYIPSTAIDSLEPEVRCFDPRAALDGGADGLAAYRAITPELQRLIRPSGLVAFECGSGQAPWLVALLAEAGFTAPLIQRDLAGHDRVVWAVAPSKDPSARLNNR
jgi:release factor glutamine methyltransferase